VALLRVSVSACICFASGLLYAHPAPNESTASSEAADRLLCTLPVRLFFCAASGLAVVFALSWWLAVYYVPLTHGCCRP
jgi:hypothetical protein